MKKIILILAITSLAVACSAPKQETPAPEKSSVVLPYTATYSSQFSQDVSDNDLLTVLNSYKSWETGDMAGLRSAYADSLTLTAWHGRVYVGSTDSMFSNWAASRDSLSSVRIEMAAWIKLRSTDKLNDFVNVWYKEVDTYKSGKVDSAEWHDINVVANGKIVLYNQYKRPFKAN